MLKLALRNLSRNRWRSGLTAGGIAVATAMLIWTEGMNEAFLSEMASSVTAVELADAQIHARDYVEERSIFHTFGEDAVPLDRLRALPAIDAAAPRVLLFGLIGNEQRSRVGRLTGVDPAMELETTRVARSITDGRWLAGRPARDGEPRECVLGRTLAGELKARVGSELVLFLQAADGSLGNDLLEVVGIARTGNSMLDRAAIYLHIEDAQFLGALEGKWHEVALRLDPKTPGAESLAPVKELLDTAAAPDEIVLRHWSEIVPDLADMIELSKRSIWILYGILYFLAGLCIFNTQRMSAFERRREFGVLLAIGVTPRRMAGLIVLETVSLAAIGGLAGVALGSAITWYHSAYGLNMGAFTSTGDGSFSYLGVDFAPRLYFRLTPRMAIMPWATLFALGSICGLWPALKSARIDSVRAIAGRT
ncbi:MAG: hypothetical protein CME06_05180 [Gemmatimonadetes bacterium]|nr:hypothetical protein [Gemmatimonadota bacterium]